jgi:hypothetical protein
MIKKITILLLIILSVFIGGAAKPTPNHYPVNRDGLLGWWSYRNTGSVSATGTWKDYSGNGNDGTCVADAYVDNLGVNLDVNLEGIGDYVSIGSFGTVSEITIAAWVRADDGLANEYSGIVSSPNWGSAGYFHFSFEYTRPSCYLHEGGTARAVVLGSVTSTGVWNHIVLTLKTGAAGMNLYENGVLVATDDVTPASFYVNDMRIGSEIEGRDLQGVVDDVQIYNRALSAGEIKANYLKNKRN